MAVDGISWIRGIPAGRTFPARCQIRYRHEAAECVVRLEADEAARVDFSRPQFAIAPGQAAVFYDGDEVMGGGWIRCAGDPPGT